MSEAYDAHLLKLLKAHTVKLGKQGEFRFVDTFFSFLRRHTEVLNSVESIEKLQEIAQKHCGDALDEHYVSDGEEEQEVPTPVTVNKTVALDRSAVVIDAKADAPVIISSMSAEQRFWKPYRTHGGYSSNGSQPAFSWSQSLREVTLAFDLGASKCSSCEVDCTLNAGVISINGKVYFDNLFSRPIRADECTWTKELVRDEQQIVLVHLEKLQTEWWSSVIADGDSIDTNLLPAITNMDELDESAKSMIKESLFKPQAEEQTRTQQLAELQRFHPELDFSQAKIQ